MNTGVPNQSIRSGAVKNSVESEEEFSEIQFSFTPNSDTANNGQSYIMISATGDADSWFEIKEIKLEKGNKATDWTPAPEDVDTEITNLQAQITDVGITVDAHEGAIAQKAERTEVYTKTETDTKLGTKVDTTIYNQKVGELTTSIDGITGRVSNTETNINNLTGEVNSVKSDVSQLEIKADGIQSTVTSLDAKVDGIEIGGRNLILNSSFDAGLTRWQSSGSNTIKLVSDGYSGHGLECILTAAGTITPRQPPSFTVLHKGSYICQVKIKTADHSDLTGITCRFANLLSLNLDSSKTIDLGNDWKQYFFTAEVHTDLTVASTNHFGFYLFKAGTVFIVDEIKLEKGNKPTDWTPAPEDVDAEINTVSTQVTQLADRYSVKTQKTSGGKTYATGFVSGINEENESEFAVLADRFRVFGTTTSDGQAVFAVDTVTKKAYFLADLIVNGLVRATALEAEQLKTHMIQAGYAVFDEANILDLEARKILAAGGAIEIGEEGIMMIPPGYAQRSMHLDGAQLAFWDKNNMPSIAMGDLTQARQNIINAGMTNLFPDGFVNGSNFPQYGFLMMQGNIALARSVLANSLMEIPGSLVGDGTLGRRKFAEKAVGIAELDTDNLFVPGFSGVNVSRSGPHQGTLTDLTTSFRQVLSFSFSKNSGIYRMEAGKISFQASRSGDGDVIIRVAVNGNILCEYQQSTSTREHSVIFDAQDLASTISVIITARRVTSTPVTSLALSNVMASQNDQLPIRSGVPVYAGLSTAPPASCQQTCQLSCQGSCETTCQTGCEGTCEDGCQTSCQSTCEKTSQSGGGCIREGTPIDVWDLESQEYKTVPVEELKPGMILPWYQPETDTVVHGELTQLVDASYSREFLRIRTTNGPSLDVTFEQPFDVLADLGQGKKWYKLQALYLRPGMQMVRPFDPEPLSTIVSVETVRESGVHFWDPKTTTGGYCVNGYADTITK